MISMVCRIVYSRIFLIFFGWKK